MTATLSLKNRPGILNPQRVRIGMLSLGCPKTLVDSEVILGKLDPARYQITPSVGECDVALLNTCSFIRDAQQESIGRILELVQLKKEKQIKALIVMGCLVQEFPKDLRKQLGQEVDAFVGSGEYAKIPEIVEKVTRGGRVFSVGTPGYLSTSGENRIALTPRHYRYLKISEGCDHICAFCTIPTFRGKHRSRTIADVVCEAERLVSEGAKEIILTGQDTSYFGRDTEGKFLLPELLRALDEAKGIEWIRLLYAYPSCLTEELMEVMRDSKHMCHYLDMPLQHASDAMLTAMRRGITKRRTYDLIKKFRAIVPDLAIRTTFIVGFPGETEQDFQELLDFMREMKFDRLGIFQYSREEDSHAAHLPGQVPEKIKEKRFHEAMLLQQEISRDHNQKWIGQTMRVLIDEQGENLKVTGTGGAWHHLHQPRAPRFWLARSYMDAPEVDGNVMMRDTSRSLQAGSFYDVRITATEDYDLVGEI